MPDRAHINGWRRVRIREVARVQTGIAKNSRAAPNGVERPYLRVANVQDGHLDLSKVTTVKVDAADVGRYELRVGDVLLTEGGDFDKLGRGTVWLGEIPGCLHQNHVFAVRPSADLLLPGFLAAWTASTEGRRYFKASSKQTTNLASINSSQVKEAPLTLPPIAEQRAILELLARLDRRSRHTTALIDAKRRFKRGLMQRLLASATSPSLSPADWRSHKLGELFCQRAETGRPELPLLAVTAGRGVVPRDQLDRRDSSNPDKSLYLRVAPGDIVYNTMRMWQGVSARSCLEGIVSPAYTVCVPGPAVDSEFAAVLFKHKPIVHLFRRHSQGLVKDTLNLKFDRLARIRVRVPEIETQRSIAALFRAIDKELALLGQLAAAFDSQKRALLDKLLSGEFRLPPV